MIAGRGASQTGRPRAAVASALLGALLCIVGAVVAPQRVAASYLVAYAASLAVVLGALAMILIARVTAATWFVVLRRQAEQVVATLPAFALMFLPVLAAVRTLYPWARSQETLPPVLRDVIHAKAAYLNLPFFTVRAAVYWATWLALGHLWRRASRSQDRGEPATSERRLRIISAAGLPAFALTVSFASFDWMMSLSPGWYSTIYGVNYFAGCMVGGLALLALLVARGRRRDELPPAVGADHVHALAKLLLTFVLFWVYIGYSQYIVIWSAEIPAEIGWYVQRTRGSWGWLGAVLVAGHFALPFCLLLVRAIKRNVTAMAFLGAWLLVMHYLDVYWIVMPDATPASASAWGYGLDAAALLLVGGVASLTWAARRVAQPMLPKGDPEISASLAYSTE